MKHPQGAQSAPRDLDADFRSFVSCLTAATRVITSDYMQLPVAGLEYRLYRERVYCYELYHQLRLRMRNHALSSYLLCGELDKSGHPYIRGNVLDRVKPDLLVHVALRMTENLVALEVKPAGRNHIDPRRPDRVCHRAIGRREVRKDLATLTAFRRHGEYHHAIYLIFGDYERGFERIRASAVALANDLGNDHIDLSMIDLYYHPMSGQSATRRDWP